MQNDIESRLKILRERYLKEPHNREIIKRQARALKISEELKKPAEVPPSQRNIDDT